MDRNESGMLLLVEPGRQLFKLYGTISFMLVQSKDSILKVDLIPEST